MKFEIPGTLPGLNEIIREAKTHYREYHKMKKYYTELVVLCIKKARLKKCDCQIDIHVTWYCPNKRKDKDNIIAGIKFILDGLQGAGIIKNDNWKHIGDIKHRLIVDVENPRIEVELKEVQDV